MVLSEDACQSILSRDKDGRNGSVGQTLDGYRVDVARHDGGLRFRGYQ